MKCKFLLIFISLLIALAMLVYFLISLVFVPNINEDKPEYTIYIPTDASFEDVLELMRQDNVLKNESSFIRVASLMNYGKNKVRSGKYIFKNGMSNKEIVSRLRSGSQSPVNVTINNVRLLSDLAGKTSRYLEPDSLAVLSHLYDKNVHQMYGFNSENFLSMFIPNTYQMYWNYSPQKFTERMKKEYDSFWNDERRARLEDKNINPTEAYILASIVEKETNYDAERARIAGVYLNRLREGMKLQADPTVVFAVGDFTLQRVLYKHLEMDSPYNTYLYEGLPPGPICMPSLQSLEAVILAEQHDYYFFCAQPDNSGKHAFAKTYSEHLKNAAAFSQWLNNRNIK